MTDNRKLAAILAADVAGYSRLMADDEPSTLRALNEFRQLFRERIEAHRGRLIDATGDSVLAEFASAVEAVVCATEIQKDLARRNAQYAEHRRMLFRIGINLGDVIEEGGSIYGDGVNVAARLQALAEPGNVCISGTVFDQVEGKLPVSFEFLGEQQVKNIPKPVRSYRPLPESSVASSAGAHGRVQVLASIAALVLGLGGAAWWYTTQSKLPWLAGQHPGAAERTGGLPSDTRPRLAVLPLDNFSVNADDEYFSDGMTEELISRLSRVSGMDVIARTSVMQYKRTAKSIADIGRELNVSSVLEGSVRKAGDKVRITVQLIDVSSQGHIWSEDYDRDVRDILATQSDISEQVAKALRVKLVAADQSSSRARTATDPVTYALYLRGRFYAGKLTPEGLKKAIEYFDQAVARSPRDAASWAGMATAYALLGWWSYAPPSESFAKAKLAAEKALALDAGLSEAYIAMGIVRFLYEWDWQGAQQAYTRAIELSPGSADAHLFYGIILKALARNDEASAQIRRANELDPLNLMASAEIGWVAYFGRRFDEAVQGCRHTLEMDPNYMFALSCLQTAETLKKDPEAIVVGKKMLELTARDPYMLGQLGWTYGVLGKREDAKRILAELSDLSGKQEVPPAAIYYVHMGLGDRDATFEYMEKAYRDRWSDMAWIKSAPEYDWLRSDPRFQAFMRKMKLE